jgi:hypothetical protein
MDMEQEFYVSGINSKNVSITITGKSLHILWCGNRPSNLGSQIDIASKVRNRNRKEAISLT